jgi:hypothetical protein
LKQVADFIHTLPANEHGYRPQIRSTETGFQLCRLGWYSQETREHIAGQVDAIVCAAALAGQRRGVPKLPAGAAVLDGIEACGRDRELQVGERRYHPSSYPAVLPGRRTGHGGGASE